MILLGCGIGVLGSTVNPFATGIASGFADVSLSDGLVLRLVILVVGLVIGIWFVMRYAERVRRGPVEVARLRHEGGRTRRTSRRRPSEAGEVVLTGRTRWSSASSAWPSW